MNNNIVKSIVFIAALLCNLTFAQVDLEKGKDALRKTDLEFSDHSKQKGMREAFLSYAAENAVLLRPNMYPVTGYVAVKKLLEEGDTNFQLTWEPMYADISTSGELGYTYGTYTLIFKDDAGNEQTRRGTYITIWKLDANGKWKFVLDTGNPGLEPKK